MRIRIGKNIYFKRDSQQALTHDLGNLVGIYVEIVE